MTILRLLYIRTVYDFKSCNLFTTVGVKIGIDRKKTRVGYRFLKFLPKGWVHIKPNSAKCTDDTEKKFNQNLSKIKFSTKFALGVCVLSLPVVELGVLKIWHSHSRALHFNCGKSLEPLAPLLTEVDICTH